MLREGPSLWQGAVATGLKSHCCPVQVRQNTDDCMAYGGFGSPTFVVNGGEHMYFGNDRLLLLERRIAVLLGDEAAAEGGGRWGGGGSELAALGLGPKL